MDDNGSRQDSSAEESIEKTEGKITVVGVRFRPCGKVYTFDAGELEVGPGTKVVVDSDMGLSLGQVATPRHDVLDSGAKRKKVLRVATEEDLEKVKDNAKLREEARTFCMEKAAELKLSMKIVDTETTLDRKKLVFYFTADGRIDFRELVRELAGRFKTRIEMRQIGVRDEVKLLGAIGACGRETCCSLFLTSFAPITIKMAKQQALSINQNKLSGVCGRLMCCLSYEYRERIRQRPEPVTAQENVPAGTPVAGTPETTAAEVPEEAGAAAQTVGELKESPVPNPEQRPEDSAERAPAPDRRRRRRRRRKGKGSPESAGPAASGKGAAPAEKPAGGRKEGEEAAKGKGRPFSRRRKFRKKKKQ